MPTSLWPPHSWPALLIGLILAIYWLRVVQMVRRTPKQAGHHANFIPPERLGRILRIIWVPVVVLWILLPLAAGIGLFGDLDAFGMMFNSRIVQWIAFVIAAVAFCLTWVCWRNMGRSWRMGIDPSEKTELVFTGPFAYVRHPIYGLSSVLMLATMAAVPSVLMVLVGITHLLLLQWEVRREERYLVAAHGDAYRQYQVNVGRFCPRSIQAYRRS